jgi:DNA-directed RNA polymerase specialized sigma24 family protein
MDELLRYMKALVALQLYNSMSEQESQPRVEVFLARAGLTYPEIGQLLGVSANAAKKSVLRSRKGAKPRSRRPIAKRRAAR